MKKILNLCSSTCVGLTPLVKLYNTLNLKYVSTDENIK